MVRTDGAGNGKGAIRAGSATKTEAENLQALLVEQLREMFQTEDQILEALPKMIKNAHSAELKAVLQKHLEETEEQKDRLDEAFKILKIPAKGKICRGMTGILEDGEEIISKSKEEDQASADLALIAAAQKVEHYEISAYGTARTLAQSARPRLGRKRSPVRIRALRPTSHRA